jgi:hypothetical protein
MAGGDVVTRHLASAVGAALILVVLAGAADGCDNPSGANCADKGATRSTSDGHRYECRQIHGHLRWVKTS